ncbi:MAG: GatB/YqeY domain-containing protein [candidate division KSB1 bacterium]|nr:GatB/YqeY domain-containing protein [candidate division KSB1 bacterium]
MSLKDKITAAAKAAQKSGDIFRLSVLRMLLTAIHNWEIEKFGGNRNSLGDDEVILLLEKEVKKRKEAAELFRKGGRGELADKEEKEILIIAEYLPPPATKEEMERAVEEAIAAGAKDMGAVMKTARQNLPGRVDSRQLSEIVKQKLGL